jgi:hypothetical protein
MLEHCPVFLGKKKAQTTRMLHGFTQLTRPKHGSGSLLREEQWRLLVSACELGARACGAPRFELKAGSFEWRDHGAGMHHRDRL